MGADFIFTAIPHCELTRERELILRRTIEQAEDHEFENLPCLLAESISGMKIELIERIAEYNGWEDNRDVGGLWTDSEVFMVTGGMSHGDSPTDTYEEMAPLADFLPATELLSRWSKEDYKNKFSKFEEPDDGRKISRFRIIRVAD